MSNSTEGDVLSEEIFVSSALLCLLLLTAASLLIAFILERAKVHWIHESLTSILLGAAFSLATKLFNANEIEKAIAFDPDTFFFLILPPIIFNAGYHLNRREFFRNFGSIILFVFVGTTVSTFVIGFMCYGVVLLGLEDLKLSLIDCLIFGSLISSTDPVAILSIFQSLKVDPILYNLVFGESAMNDAVSIVLYEVLIGFRTEEITSVLILKGLGSFFGIFLGSFVVGVIIGCLSALMFKHIKLHELPLLESGLFVVIAYISYMSAQAVGLSGIVSMLFCAISMAHYTFQNLSEKSQHTTKFLFNILSFMAENFVFVYLGVSIFAPNSYVYKPIFISLVLIIIIIARAVYVFPLSMLINCFTRDQSQKIKTKHQVVIVWAGLRGAMAFMLALKIDWEAGPLITTTTLMIVLLTVALFGSPTAPLLKLLKIKMGQRQGQRQNSMTDPEETLRVRPRPLSIFDRTHWFISMDQKYFEPFLTKPREYSNLTEDTNHHESGYDTHDEDERRKDGGEGEEEFEMVERENDLEQQLSNSKSSEDQENEIEIENENEIGVEIENKSISSTLSDNDRDSDINLNQGDQVNLIDSETKVK